MSNKILFQLSDRWMLTNTIEDLKYNNLYYGHKCHKAWWFTDTKLIRFRWDKKDRCIHCLAPLPEELITIYNLYKGET